MKKAEGSGFMDAAREAAIHRKGVTTPEVEEQKTFGPIDKRLFDYFFELQVRLEKEGAAQGKGMDYHAYARCAWNELMGEIDETNRAAFEYFEKALIYNLHSIDMTEHVYEEAVGSLGDLIEQYEGDEKEGKGIKNIALWSTGDVEATGYQAAKIASSRIIREFYQALRSKLPEDRARNIFQEKTSYMVEGNKFRAMAEYAKSMLENETGELKFVVVEDSLGNFKKIEDALREVLGEDAERIKLVPIWATYSRIGKEAEANARENSEMEDFEAQKHSLNAINSFRDLLDEERFREILSGAYLFVDFDGVIGNNITMREEQAKATYKALMNGAMSYEKEGETDLVERMKKRIAALEA